MVSRVSPPCLCSLACKIPNDGLTCKPKIFQLFAIQISIVPGTVKAKVMLINLAGRRLIERTMSGVRAKAVKA